MKKIFLFILFSFVAVSNIHAEMIELMTGETVECSIVKRSESFIRVSCDKGVPIREYLISEIASITKDGNIEYINAMKTEPNKASNVLGGGAKENPVVLDNNTINELFKNQKIITEDKVLSDDKLIADNEKVSITIIGSSSPDKLREKIRGLLRQQEMKAKSFFRDKGLDPNKGKMYFVELSAFMLFVLYLLTSFPIFMLSRKLSTGLSLLAWIPFVNLFLLCRMAGISCKWLMIMLFPLVNVFFVVIFSCVLWWYISQRCQKPGWLGLLMILPVISVIIPFYLAISYKAQEVNNFEDHSGDVLGEPSIKEGSNKTKPNSQEEMKKKILGDTYLKGKSTRL